MRTSRLKPNAIAPINEPATFKSNTVLPATKQLYEYAYTQLRHPFPGRTEGDLVLVLHDGFLNLKEWDGFMTPPEYVGVVMDHHSYGVFSTPELQQTEAQHISVCLLLLEFYLTFNLMCGMVTEQMPIRGYYRRVLES